MQHFGVRGFITCKVSEIKIITLSQLLVSDFHSIEKLTPLLSHDLALLICLPHGHDFHCFGYEKVLKDTSVLGFLGCFGLKGL